MIRPFVVFSLPRSRSAWLSVLLSQGGLPVGHDVGVECRTPEDFAARVAIGGTCETGVAFAWPLIRQLLPGARYVVVRRRIAEVEASLARFGLTGVRAELERRWHDMAEHEDPTDTLVVDYADLRDEEVCRRIFRHCRGQRMDHHWWAQLDPLNIQVDMSRQISRLAVNRPQIDALKAEVRRRLAHG